MPIWDQIKDTLDGHDDKTTTQGGVVKDTREVEVEHEHSKAREDTKKKEEGDIHPFDRFSDKIKDVFDGGESEREKERQIKLAREQAELEAKRQAEAKAKEAADKEKQAGWAGMIPGLAPFVLAGQEHERRGSEEAAEKLRIQQEEERKRKEEEAKHHGFRGHVRDILDGPDDDKKIPKKPEEPAHWTDRIKGAFDGHDESIARQRHEPEEEGWKGKLKDVFDGASPGEKSEAEKHRKERDATKAAEEERDWKDKIKDVVSPPPPPKEEHGWLHQKVTELAGGGAKSEAKEDKLDKTVDFVQKHVLGKGDQHNESAFEQAKDEQISDGIRKAYKSVTGHELPVGDKPH